MTHDDYNPPPTVIEERKRQVRWLESLGFSQHFIANVMQLDCPEFQIIEKEVIRACSDIEAKYKNFLEPTEYRRSC